MYVCMCVPCATQMSSAGGRSRRALGGKSARANWQMLICAVHLFPSRRCSWFTLSLPQLFRIHSFLNQTAFHSYTFIRSIVPPSSPQEYVYLLAYTRALGPTLHRYVQPCHLHAFALSPTRPKCNDFLFASLVSATLRTLQPGTERGNITVHCYPPFWLPRLLHSTDRWLDRCRHEQVNLNLDPSPGTALFLNPPTP